MMIIKIGYTLENWQMISGSLSRSRWLNNVDDINRGHSERKEGLLLQIQLFPFSQKVISASAKPSLAI